MAPKKKPQATAAAPTAKRAADEAFAGESEPEAPRQTARQKASKGHGPRLPPQQRTLANNVKPTSHLAVHETDKRASKETGEVFSKPELAQLERIKQAIKAVEFSTLRKPTPTELSINAAGFEQLFSQPRVEGRNFKPDVVDGPSKKTKNSFLLGARQGSDYRIFTIVDKLYCPTNQAAQQITQLLTDLLNSWPGTLDTLAAQNATSIHKGTTAGHACFDIAYHQIFPNEKKRMLSPIYRLDAQKKPSLLMNFRFLPDFASGVAEVTNEGLTLVLPATIVDGVPESLNTTWIKSTSAKAPVTKLKNPVEYAVTVDPQTGTETIESALPEDLGEYESKRQQFLEAEKLARLLVSRLSGKRLTMDQVKKQLPAYVDMYGSMKKRKLGSTHGLYGGHNLFSVNRHTGQRIQFIAPSAYVRKDIKKGKLPTIIIHSLDRSRALGPINALNNSWLAHGDLPRAWLAAAECAKLVNRSIAEGLPRHSDATIGATDRSQETCTCASCGRSMLNASHRIGTWGLPVCGACDAHLIAKEHSAPEVLLRSSAMQAVRLECEKAGMRYDSKAGEALVEAIHEDLADRFKAPSLKDDAGRHTMLYPDAYCGINRSMPPEGFTPTQPSLDAIFPYGLDAQGRTRVHCKGNVEITSLAANYAKHIQVPAFLHCIRWYMRESEKVAASEMSPMELNAAMIKIQVQVINHSTNCRRVRMKHGYTKVSRLNKKISKQRYALDLEELRTTQLRPSDMRPDRPWMSRRYYWSQAKWPAEVIKRVKDVATQLQEEFRVILPVGEDGCPFPGIKKAMPADYGWGFAASFAADRYNRMREQCNGLHPTWDTPEEIFIEIIFVICVISCVIDDEQDKFWSVEEKLAFKNRYSEFLGLPWVFESWDGLCLAVAHAEHGQMMYTGWKNAPTTLADRKDAQNNLLIETRTSNFLKSDFPKRFYDDLKRMMRDTRMPDRYVSTTRTKLPDVPSEMQDNIEGITEKEALDFEDQVVDPQLFEPFAGDAVAEGDFIDDEFDFEDLGEEGDSAEVEEELVMVDPDQVELLKDEHQATIEIIRDRAGHRANDPQLHFFLRSLSRAQRAGDRETFNIASTEVFTWLDDGVGDIEETGTLGEASGSGRRNLQDAYVEAQESVATNHPDRIDDPKVQGALNRMHQAAGEQDHDLYEKNQTELHRLLDG